MKHPRLQLNKRAFWCGVAVLVLLRCGLTSFQQAYTWVGGAPLDDELMFRAAQAITAGEWLGTYDYLTLSKAMFFPVWLALLHVLHLPYLVSGAALWCAASLLAAFAFAPLWRNAEPGCGRVLTLGLFGALAFLPSGWAAYTLRVYRDNIFPALCLVFFAGMAGMALRAVVYTAKQKPLWPWLLAAGVGCVVLYIVLQSAARAGLLYYSQHSDIQERSIVREVERLQRYVTAQQLSAKDTRAIDEWVGQQGFVLLNVYRGQRMLYSNFAFSVDAGPDEAQEPRESWQVRRAVQFADGTAEVKLF